MFLAYIIVLITYVTGAYSGGDWGVKMEIFLNWLGFFNQRIPKYPLPLKKFLLYPSYCNAG